MLLVVGIDRWPILWFAICSSVIVIDGTSLMRRIRQQQNADDVLNKNLDLESEDWLHVPHSVQDVLMSIDDKLRGLDTLSYTLKLAHLDFSLDQLVKRMESIETKVGRLETKFDLRMEKVEEVVISKDIKEEFSNEHLSRRMEHLNEKINAKAAYLDGKLEFKLGRIMNKLELLERDLHSSTDDILERLIRRDEQSSNFESKMSKREEKFDALDNNVKELRSFLKEKFQTSAESQTQLAIEGVRTLLRNTTIQTETLFKEMRHSVLESKDVILEAVEKTSNKLETCPKNDRVRSLSSSGDRDNSRTTQQQLNNLTTMLEKAFQNGEAKLKELDTDVELYTNKVINGIQELWKSSDQVKLDLSSTLEQGSKTRELVRQEFLKLHEQIEPLPKIEPKLSHISEDLDKKVVELSATVDNSFGALLVAQNSFITSCHRIQDEETHVYDILQQIVYEMRNRSTEDIRKINNELQQQTSRINNSLSNVVTAILTAGNLTTLAMKRLHHQLRNNVLCSLRNHDIDWEVIENLCNPTTTEKPPETSDDEVLLGQHDLPIDDEELEIDKSSRTDEALITRRNISKRGKKWKSFESNSSSSILPFDYETNYQYSDRDYD